MADTQMAAKIADVGLRDALDNLVSITRGVADILFSMSAADKNDQDSESSAHWTLCNVLWDALEKVDKASSEGSSGNGEATTCDVRD